MIIKIIILKKHKTKMETIINRLNENIYKLKDFDYNVEFAEDLIWDDLVSIRNCKDKTVINEWKYGTELLLIEEQHENDTIVFGKDLTWIQSYVMGLLFTIWH